MLRVLETRFLLGVVDVVKVCLILDLYALLVECVIVYVLMIKLYILF